MNTQDTFKNTNKKQSKQDIISDKQKSIFQHSSSGVVIGILLVATGVYMYILSLFPAIAQYNNYLLLIVGLYFMISFWICKLHKIFFFLGEILLLLWVGSILEDITNQKNMFSIILILLGVIMIVYATYFRISVRKKTISIRFLVVGIIIILFGILLLLTITNAFSFAFFWEILRPLILILFGVVLINRWWLERQLYKNNSEHTHEKINTYTVHDVNTDTTETEEK